MINDKYTHLQQNSVKSAQKFLLALFCYLERGSQDPPLFPGLAHIHRSVPTNTIGKMLYPCMHLILKYALTHYN